MEGLLMRDEAPKIIETVTMRRAKIADADKIRYRVYTTATEFVAVIAESALMAVKVSGIAAPYKIMRDFPTEGIAIEAKRMAAIEDVPERVNYGREMHVRELMPMTELPNKADIPVAPFVAVGLADLRMRKGSRERILPPELVHEIIEQHAKVAQAEAAIPEAIPQVTAAEYLPETIAAAVEEAPSVSAEEQMIQAPRELTVEEKINQLADEFLPPSSAATNIPVSAASTGPLLSSDDVEKLLHEKP
ncbi:MAG: hypothetical protein ACKVOE_07345 [Rickettsiales bacterium]